MGKIVVGGAAGLLGKSLVRALCAQNDSVIAVDINEQCLKDSFEKEIDSGKLSLQAVNLTDEEQVITFFGEQEGLTGAVNCSYPRNQSYGAHFYDVSLSSFNENVSLHLGSSFLFAQQCAKYFKQHSTQFSLVNVASIYGVVAPDFSVYNGTSMTMPVEYAAIKSAVIHLNKYVAAYVNDSRFRVNSVSPGGIKDGQPEPFLDKYRACTLGKGMLDVEDVIDTIVFLLSPQARYINGQNILVDDGFSL
ncbi:MAG: oxidoreductase [Aestuariibacter sp.]